MKSSKGTRAFLDELGWRFERSSSSRRQEIKPALKKLSDVDGKPSERGKE